ncbi:hypothetical protein [Streptomyces longwoodensis]|uniref:hypothetical protein n=1 Tax=Streptomyces longwoodensis TaxID=68231 RepID=UPI0036EC3001
MRSQVHWQLELRVTSDADVDPHICVPTTGTISRGWQREPVAAGPTAAQQPWGKAPPATA